MLVNLLKITGISVLAGGYYLNQYNRISLTNPWFRQLFATIESHKPQYSQTIFKMLIQLGFVERQQLLQNYIMKSGFDLEGSYLKELSELGFRGVEVGPTSYNPSLEQDPQFYFGINNVIANVCTFHQNNNSPTFEIQICIAPNHEVLKYTPYLLKQNICEALKNYIGMQKLTQQNIVNNLNLDFHRGQYHLEEHNPEVIAMKSQIKDQCNKLIVELNTNRTHPININFLERKKGYLQWQKLLGFILGRESL